MFLENKRRFYDMFFRVLHMIHGGQKQNDSKVYCNKNLIN